MHLIDRDILASNVQFLQAVNSNREHTPLQAADNVIALILKEVSSID